MKICKVLKDISVIIEDQAINQGQLIYFCKTPHLDSEFFGSHVIIVDNKNEATKILSSSPIKIKDREKTLEVINDINQELTCGCVTLSEDNYVCYDMAIFFLNICVIKVSLHTISNIVKYC